MKKLFAKFVASTLSLWIISLLLENVFIDSFQNLITLSIVLGILNISLKPLLKLFSLPVTVLTLGLFSFVINAVVLKIAFYLIPGVALTGILGTLIASVLLSVINSVLEFILK